MFYHFGLERGGRARPPDGFHGKLHHRAPVLRCAEDKVLVLREFDRADAPLRVAGWRLRIQGLGLRVQGLSITGYRV